MRTALVALDGPERGARAMARDRQLVLGLGPGPGLAGLVRLHGWFRPCVSVGRAQSLPDGAIEKLSRQQVEVTRRPTGGGWLLHLPGDLAVTWASPGPLGRGALRDAAGVVAAAIAEGLRGAGVSAEVTDARAAGSRADVCFQRADREEVVAGGVKVAGVAIARIGRCALVQAAIPLVAAPATLADLEAVWDPRRADAVARTFRVDAHRLRRLVRAALGEALEARTTRWFWPPDWLVAAERASARHDLARADAGGRDAEGRA